jgi:formylglycine-generating enzyme required for sulfatase activity
MDSTSTPSSQTIRIFISSPGDVEAERLKAAQVIEQLGKFYGDALVLQPVLWKQMPLEVNQGFQPGIDTILSADQGIDIAIFILWSRLGTPVTIGDRTFASGTEREWHLMLEALAQSGGERPDILFYRRRDEEGFTAGLAAVKPELLQDAIDQNRAAEAFMQAHFWDREGKNIRAYHGFQRPIDFATILKVHLRALIDRRLNDRVWLRGATWTEEPYRGLEPFQLEHAPIFFGREAEISELETRLRQRDHAPKEPAFLAVIGASGSGKSSVVRAGLRATLTNENLDESVAAWRSIAMIPAQAQGDLFGGLVRELATDPRGLPELLSGGLTQEDLRLSLQESVSATFRTVLKPALVRAATTAGGVVKLLVVVDQFEEIFTDKKISPENRERFLEGLELLALSGYCWVVVTMRSDFYEQAQTSAAFLRLKGERGQYDLLPPGPDALQRIITEPARLAGLRFEKRPDGTSLVAQILKDARGQSDLLPLLSDLLLDLYQHRKDNVIPFAAYEAYADAEKEQTGLEGVLSTRAEAVFQRLNPEAQATCPQILHALVTVEGESDVRRRANKAALMDTPDKAALVQAFIDARLLTSDDTGQGAQVTLAHEALLRKWDRVVAWVRANRQHLRIRTRIETVLKRWRDHGQHTDLLLPEGLDLEEGLSLLRDAPELIAGPEYEGVRTYIAASRDHHAARRRKEQRVRATVTTVLLSLTLAALGGLAYAGVQLVKSRHAEGLALLLRAEVAQERNKRYPDTLLYAAEAIGYQGQGAPEGPFAPAGVDRFVRKDLHPADFERATKWIAEKPGYRPVWVGTVDGPVRDLQVTPHGRFLAVNTDTGPTRWDFTVPEKPVLQKGSHALKLDGELQPVPGGVFDLDAAGETVAVADAKGIQVGKQLLPTPSPALQLRFDPRDATLAAIHADGTCRLYFHHSLGAPHQAWAAHKPEAPVRSVAYDPVRDRIALGDAEGMISVWNVADAQKIDAIATPERHEKPVSALDYRADGRRLISGSEDGTLRLWNSERDVPVLLATLTGHAGPVTVVRYLPGGQLVASGGADGTVRLWTVEEEKGQTTDWHAYVNEVNQVNQAWYQLNKAQEFVWKQGSGFLPLPETSIVAQWRSGTEPPRPDAWAQPGLLAAFEAAQKAGRFHEARLRARQMTWLGLQAPQVAFEVNPGEAFDNGEGAKMLWCKPGTFTMGDTEQWDAKPHEVTLTEGYWLARTEVTQAVYEAVMGTNPSTNAPIGPQAPVENLSWFEAEAFCQRLTDRERARGTIPPGWEYRLPTEAQWEYACRAGTTTAYSFGDEVEKLHLFGNYNDKSGGAVGYANPETEHDDGHGYTAPVGSFGENPWGFLDMHGNVFEWCLDSVARAGPDSEGNYDDGVARVDPVYRFAGQGAHRVGRGGGFGDASAFCRSGFRLAYQPTYRISGLGFRPALVPGFGTRPAN